jgi:hypothetical protein
LLPSTSLHDITSLIIILIFTVVRISPLMKSNNCNFELDWLTSDSCWHAIEYVRLRFVWFGKWKIIC